MVFPFLNKDKQDNKASADASNSSQQGANGSKPDVAKTAEPAVSMPKPSSVFEFGTTVQVGADFMRGVCTGDDPDAIQACTWSVEPLQGKAKEKKHLYRIEF